MKWIIDPYTKLPSVSLTLLIVFGFFALGANTLAVFKQVQSTGGLDNLFFACLALYFGRKNVTIGGKTYTSAAAEEIKEKVDA